MDDWVSSLREQVAAGLMKPRTYNRRIAAISSLYRWASEPTRSAVTGIPRNPMPRRATYVVPKLAKPMSEDDLGMVGAASHVRPQGIEALSRGPCLKRFYAIS